MPWGEALRLTQTLAADPTSQISTALAGWDYPTSREAMALMDAYDLSHMVAWSNAGGKGAKPKPYPRPWRTAEVEGVRRLGNTEGRSRAEVVAYLNSLGHHLPE